MTLYNQHTPDPAQPAPFYGLRIDTNASPVELHSMGPAPIATAQHKLDGIELVQCKKPDRSSEIPFARSFSWREMGSIIKAQYIERVKIPLVHPLDERYQLVMYVDEEGVLHQRQGNRVASMMYPTPTIHGPAFLIWERVYENGETDHWGIDFDTDLWFDIVKPVTQAIRHYLATYYNI